MTNARAAEALGVSTDVASAPKPPTTISGMLQTYRAEIARALPRHMTADRMVRIALTELRKVPKLTECEPKSLFGAIIQCAQLGLEPGGALGHAYLLPFRNNKTGRYEVQLLVGYRGMIDLARRSEKISTLFTHVVYAKDKFEYELGLEPRMVHVPNEEEDRGELRGAYCVCKFKDGGVQFEYMSRKQIDSIRARSKSKDSGPWVTDYDEMARKTVVRRVFKYLPVSIELQETMTTLANLDHAVDIGDTQHNDSVIDGVATEVLDPQEQGQENKEAAPAKAIEHTPSPDADFIAAMDKQEKVEAAKGKVAA